MCYDGRILCYENRLLVRESCDDLHVAAVYIVYLPLSCLPRACSATDADSAAEAPIWGLAVYRSDGSIHQSVDQATNS